MADAADSGLASSEARALGAFLATQPDPPELVAWRALAGGRSATSVLVGLARGGDRTDAVLHIEPADGPLAGIPDARRQFALLQALEPTDVPAPRPLHFVPAEVLGRAAYLTDFAPGEAPDPWRRAGREYLAAHRDGLREALVQRLVAIHRVGLDALPRAMHDAFPAEQSFAQREHRRWSAVLGCSAAFADDPVLAYADAWLGPNMPVARAGLMHGDYRMGNVVCDADEIVCVLDWELSEIGDPRYDVATLCSPPLRVDGLAAGLWEPDALVARYEAVIGEALDRDALHYYVVLCTFKIACLWVNASLPYSEGRDDLASLRAGFSAVDLRPMLAEALGLDGAPPALGPPVGDRALQTVRSGLRAAAGELPAGAARELVGLGAAVLDARQRVGPGPLPTALAGEVRELVADVAARTGALEIAPEDPWLGLGPAARNVVGDSELGGDVGDPLHERLRALVATAARSPVSRWASV